MRGRAFLFGLLAIVCFVISLIALSIYSFGAANLLSVRADGYFSDLHPLVLFLWIVGSTFTAILGFLSWRNGVAAEQKLKHDEMMEGLKAIYRVLRIQLDDAPPPPNTRSTAKEAGQPGVGLSTWYDLTQEERELIRKKRTG